jgi:hypothetical protein
MPNLAAKSYGKAVHKGQFSFNNLPTDRRMAQAMDLIERISREIITAESEVQGLSARIAAGEQHPGLPLMLSAAESWLKDRQVALKKAQKKHDQLCGGLANA